VVLVLRQGGWMCAFIDDVRHVIEKSKGRTDRQTDRQTDRPWWRWADVPREGKTRRCET
jgi:hypothetical protein